MHLRNLYRVFGLFIFVVFSHAALGQNDVKDIESVKKTVRPHAELQYFMMQRAGEAAPKGGYKVMMILPGGNGSAQFEPFVQRIMKYALPKGYVVVQPIAVKWTEAQKIVWPTKVAPVKGMKFTTEQAMDAILKDVSKQVKVDKKHVYAMGWSSSGPAVYAAALRKKTPFKGYYVSMSVFKENERARLRNAEKQKFYIEHGDSDRVCPLWMAKKAAEVLKANKAKVEFSVYQGGHGWVGNPYGRIKKAVGFLEGEEK